MPQLDPTWYPALFFWLVIIFPALMLVMKFAIRPITKVIDERQKRVDDNLKEAKELKEQAEGMIKDYEDKIASARLEVSKHMEQARVEISKQIQEKEAEFQANLVKSIKDSEGRLRAEYANSEKQLVAVATELAAEVVERMGFAGISKSQIEQVAEQIAAEQTN